MSDMIPYQAKLVIPLREKDDQFMKIQELIDAKRGMLISKQKDLQMISKQNEFLESVKGDYQKYYNYISQQKNDQIKALELLDEYIRDLTTSGSLTKHNIEDAKAEQVKIMNEVGSIKQTLDSIINDTQYIVNNRN